VHDLPTNPDNIPQEESGPSNREDLVRPSVSPPNPFDPERLRLTQDFGSRIAVKKLLITIPVRKPSKETFVRTHPDPSYWLNTAVIELKEDREIYLVDPSLWQELATEATFAPKLLVATVTRQGVLSLWPIRLPGPDGRIDDWNHSALQAAEEAKKSWVRVQANMGLGAYDIVTASSNMGLPEFPTMEMVDILKIAFKDKYVSGTDHIVLRRLRGEV
jgi:hypothetical protein